MDIKQQPLDIQKKWLNQRGWREGKPGMWVDPNTRTSYYITIALDRAVAECHIASDLELKPDVPPRKDDAPPPITGSTVPPQQPH